MAKGSDGRGVLQGIAGRDGSKIGKRLKTPKGFPRATTLFSDMSRYFGGTWFDDVESQVDLDAKATAWEKRLSRFEVNTVVEAMAEIIKRGDFKAPSLETINYLCQRLTDEAASRSGASSKSSRAARDRAMAQLKQQGVIRG